MKMSDVIADFIGEMLSDGGGVAELQRKSPVSYTHLILLLMARKNKKREAGSGSITKRKDGRWQGQYVSDYEDVYKRQVYRWLS